METKNKLILGTVLFLIGFGNLLFHYDLMKEFKFFGLCCFLAIGFGSYLITTAVIQNKKDIEYKDDPKHKEFLLEVYTDLWNKSIRNGFYDNLYKQAIHRLTVGQPPKRVEDWVANCEKAWRKF